MVDILLVEDEAELAELLRVYMEKAGYTVYWAASGEEALDCLQKEPVKMLLLDITLVWMVLQCAGKCADAAVYPF